MDRYFKNNRRNSQEKEVRVSEVFLSFQGEGVNTGHPRVFVRLATGCPLMCSFCDSTYARSLSRPLSEEDIQLIKSHPWIVFTGNEPLFSNGPEWMMTIIDMIQPDCNSYIEVETNGTVVPSLIRSLLKHVSWWTISPKDPATQRRKVDTTPHLLEWFRKHYHHSNYVVKFVYNDEQSGVFILKTVERYGIDPGRVWIMPRGETRAVYHKHLVPAWKFALSHGFNLSPRLHIDTFDKKRGV
jgi:7-carboxy-7-deazaguanine synthase